MPSDRGSGGPPLRAIQGGRGGVSLRPSDMQGRIGASEFMVPAQDTHGHSARMECRVPPSMVREVSILISAGDFPFKTTADFMRWAIYRAVGSLEEIKSNGNLSNVRALTSSLVLACRVEQDNLDYKDALDGLCRTIQNLLSAGANINAKRLYKECLQQIEQMDDPYWRERYLKDLRERFGYLEGKKKGKDE